MLHNRSAVYVFAELGLRLFAQVVVEVTLILAKFNMGDMYTTCRKNQKRLSVNGPVLCTSKRDGFYNFER
jgi:hypothetical protein